MSKYKCKYQFIKPGSGSGNTSYIEVDADSDIVAIELAKGNAQNRHKGYEINILGVDKK